MSTKLELPRRARALFDALVAAEPVSAARLAGELDAWLARVEARATTHEFFDTALARSLARSARGLVELLEGGTLDDTRRRLAQAAVRYLVLTEDAEHDLSSMLGLDDDAAVLNAVARALGRSDLVVST